VLSIGVWLIRNRENLPESNELMATRGRAFLRLFGGDDG
jgi:hypothetical protein